MATLFGIELFQKTKTGFLTGVQLYNLKCQQLLKLREKSWNLAILFRLSGGDEENRPNYDVFVNFENEIVSKSLTDNVATIQTNTTHNFIVGSEVVVSGIDATFDGTYSVSSINSATSFSYVRTAADVSETSSDGIVSGYFYHGTTPIHTYSFLSNISYSSVKVAIQVASIEKERASSITIFESPEIPINLVELS